MKEMKIRGDFPFPPKGYFDKPVEGIEFIKYGFENFKHWDRPLLVQEKLDGWFGEVIKKNNECRWGADWKQYSKLQEPLKYFNSMLPNDSRVLCEVMYGTQKGAKMTNELGYVKSFCFDALQWEGEDISNLSSENRFNIIEERIMKNQIRNKGNDKIDIVSYFNYDPKVHSYNEVFDFFGAIICSGGEGVILKDCNEGYKEGIETQTMWKIKNFVTKPYILMGFEQTSAQTYLDKGMTVSNMLCGLFDDNKKLHYITRTSGFDYVWRKKFSDNPQEYIGKVVDLGGFEIFKTGAMRHSSFLWFNPEIDHYDCRL